MTDRKNFEALLDAYVSAMMANNVQRMELAKTGLLAAYDAAAGREGHYLADGMRFKLAATRSGAAAEFRSFPAELAGKWVALVDATDDKHLFTHPAPKADAAASAKLLFWQDVPDEKAKSVSQKWAYALGFNDAMIAASPARVGEGEKDAAMWEDEAHRLTGLIAEVVRLADSNPFCAIGHAVEHVIPHLREALTDALPPSAAMSREAQDT